MSNLIRQKTDSASASFGYGSTYPAGSIGQTFKDQANQTDPAKGAAMLGRVVKHVTAINAVSALGLIDGISIIAKTRSVAGDGGGGIFHYDAASVVTADNAFVFAPTVGPGRFFRDGYTVFGYNGELIPEYFGARGDDVTDDLAALNAAVVYTKAIKGRLLFGDKTYLVSQTFAMGGADNTHYEGTKKTAIRCTGAGPVASCDAGAYPAYNDNITIKGFVFKGNAASTYGLYTRGHIRSSIKDLRAVNITLAGYKFDWSVLNAYENIFLSSEMDTFTVIPAKGLVIDQSGTARSTANVFINTVMEGPVSSRGIDIVAGDINTFIGGSAESVPTGVGISSISRRNHFVSFDCEGNTNLDIDDAGQGTVYSNVSCSSALAVNVILEPTSASTVFNGGYIGKIALNGSQIGPTVFNATQFSDAGGITGAGSYIANGCNKVNASLTPTGEVDTGEFTPAFVGATTPGVQNYSVRKGLFQRHGRVITFQIFMTVTANSGGVGTALLTGFPFAARNVAGLAVEYVFTSNTGVVFTASRNRMVMNIAPGTVVGVIVENTNGTGTAALPISAIGPGDYVICGSFVGEK